MTKRMDLAIKSEIYTKESPDDLQTILSGTITFEAFCSFKVSVSIDAGLCVLWSPGTLLKTLRLDLILVGLGDVIPLLHLLFLGSETVILLPLSLNLSAFPISD